MRALLIIQDFLPDLPGGIANYVYHICAKLTPDVEVLTPAYGEHIAFDQVQSFPIHRRRIPVQPPAFMRESRFHWLRLPYVFYIAVAQLTLFVWHGLALDRRRRYDVILIGHLYLAPVGWLLGRLGDKPYTVMLHGGELHRYFHWAWVRRPLLAFLNRAKFLVVNTQFTQQQYIQRGVRADQNFVLVYPGVDTRRFRPGIDGRAIRTRHGLDGVRLLLTVARLVEWKGHALVLRALPAVLRQMPDVRYLIAGSGPYRPDLERLVRDLGIQTCVTFAGFVPDDQLPAVYASADLLVQASRTTNDDTALEGFGITFVEAGACGLPVIGGRTGGVGEAIAEGVTGLLVDPDDPSALAATILALLQNRKEASRLGQQGRERAVRKFDWSIQTQRLRDFLAAVRDDGSHLSESLRPEARKAS